MESFDLAPLSIRGLTRCNRLVWQGPCIILVPTIRIVLHHDLVGFFGSPPASSIVSCDHRLRTCSWHASARCRESHRAPARDCPHPVSPDSRCTHRQLERYVRPDGGVLSRRHLECCDHSAGRRSTGSKLNRKHCCDRVELSKARPGGCSQ